MAVRDDRRAGPFRDVVTVPATGSRGNETQLFVFGAVTLSHPVAEGTTLTIGRSLDADLCLDDPSLSRIHARITIGPATSSDSGLRIRDLSSSNGTRIGGQRIDPEHDVHFQVGDLIGVGSCTLLIQRPGADRFQPGSPVRADVVIEDDGMRKLYDLGARIAASDLSVLLLGETGVGKEVFARTIHERSKRKDQPFLALNCGAFSDELLESELFGHERGAFTGAVSAKVGLFETAKGGTVFLDEVAEMSQRTQVKLLRVIEDRHVRAVGGLTSVPIDVRVIAATNRDLPAMVRRGEFREDLYYRLNGTVLLIPPLRDRRGEIPFLARALVRRAAGTDVPFSDPAMRMLREHDWPGNVRELKNVVERANVLSGGAPIEVEHLAVQGTAPREPRELDPRAPIKSAIEELEKKRIMEALDECGGNQSEAAKLLGMSRKTFVRRLDQYGIPRPRKGRDD